MKCPILTSDYGSTLLFAKLVGNLLWAPTSFFAVLSASVFHRNHWLISFVFVFCFLNLRRIFLFCMRWRLRMFEVTSDPGGCLSVRNMLPFAIYPSSHSSHLNTLASSYTCDWSRENLLFVATIWSHVCTRKYLRKYAFNLMEIFLCTYWNNF